MDEVRVCEVENEAEAILVVGVLNDAGIEARSDATPSSTVFGGLPFESGHGVYVPAASGHKAREVLSHYPHFQNPPRFPDE